MPNILCSTSFVSWKMFKLPSKNNSELMFMVVDILFAFYSNLHSSVSGFLFPGLQCDGTAEDTLCQRNFRAGEDCGFSARTVSCPRPDLPRTGNGGQANTKQLYLSIQYNIHQNVFNLYNCLFFSPLMQVALNQAYTETLNSASDVLSATIKEQSGLMEEVRSIHVFRSQICNNSYKLQSAGC